MAAVAQPPTCSWTVDVDPPADGDGSLTLDSVRQLSATQPISGGETSGHAGRKSTLDDCVTVLSAAEGHAGGFERWVSAEAGRL